MMERLIGNILLRMELSGLINKNDKDVYKFGLECLFLKILHYSSYLFISFLLHMVLPLLVSAVIFLPLRSKSGGYHAKTRLGCYLFSCSMVTFVCILNKCNFAELVTVIALCIANSIICLLAPVENSNRKLSLEEKRRFRRQGLALLSVADAVIIAAMLNGWRIYQWLLNGLVVVAILILLGKTERITNN